MPINFNELVKAKNQHWFITSLNEYLDSDRSFREPDGYFHPSSMSYRIAQECDRFAQFSLWVNTASSIFAKTRRIFDVGSDMHLRYQRYFAEMGILVEAEKEVLSEQYHVTGHLDAIIKKPFSEQLVVVELKSINTTDFNNITRPKYEHEIQLKLYMGVEGIGEGIVVYEDKNDQNIKVFDYEHDFEFWEFQKSRFQRIWNEWKQKIPSRNTENVELCERCAFFQRCKGDRAEYGAKFLQ